MSSILPKSGLLALSFVLGFCWQNPVWAKLSSSQLTTLLRANARARVSNINILGEGPLVTVVADKNASASDKELKIDAIFLGKTLLEGAPGQVTDIKVIFSQQDREGRYIQISAQQIKDFGSGKIEPDKFLASINLIPVAGEQIPDVVQGPQFERRLLIWKRIDHLRKMGTGVRPFQLAFKEVETQVSSGKPEDLSDKISNLERTLAQQENILQEARRVARGKGIVSASGGKSFGQIVQKGGLPAQNTLPGQEPAQAPDNNYIPAQANQIKAAFNRSSDQLVRQVEMKDRSKGQTARTLRTNINALFTQGKQAEAYRTIREFQTLVYQTTGIDLMSPEGGPQGQGGGPQGQGGGPMGGGGPPGGPPNGGPPNGGPPF
ncbi:MAG: hypothetical protein KIT34_04690 [Cyanobacteria bacterium TGS_CYA1]|nr:hypothetical protein [Cyanobacteria bacterium TGS_CYA1]